MSLSGDDAPKMTSLTSLCLRIKQATTDARAVGRWWRCGRESFSRVDDRQTPRRLGCRFIQPSIAQRDAILTPAFRASGETERRRLNAVNSPSDFFLRPAMCRTGGRQSPRAATPAAPSPRRQNTVAARRRRRSTQPISSHHSRGGEMGVRRVTAIAPATDYSSWRTVVLYLMACSGEQAAFLAPPSVALSAMAGWQRGNGGERQACAKGSSSSSARISNGVVKINQIDAGLQRWREMAALPSGSYIC